MGRSPLIGQQMFIKIVDQSTVSRGLITIDNFEFDVRVRNVESEALQN